MTTGLTVSKIGRAERSEGSRHHEIDFSSSLKMQFTTTLHTIEVFVHCIYTDGSGLTLRRPSSP